MRSPRQIYSRHMYRSMLVYTVLSLSSLDFVKNFHRLFLLFFFFFLKLDLGEDFLESYESGTEVGSLTHAIILLRLVTHDAYRLAYLRDSRN